MNSASVERRPVPKRARPFAKAHKHIPWVLKMFLGRELSPSRDEYDRVVDALWDGDVEMDKLMAWMYDSDTTAARKMFRYIVYSWDGFSFNLCVARFGVNGWLFAVGF